MKAWIAKQLNDGTLDFAKLERLIWFGLIAVFQRLLIEVLEVMDKVLASMRDTQRYVLKERKERTLQTLVGEITFKRRYYWDRQEEEWVFLLDERLGLESYEQISPGMLQLAVTWAAKGPSYRDARDRMKDLYGVQVLSHEAIRQVLCQVGEAAQRERDNQIVRSEGNRRVKALFVEVDGFNAYLQSRKKTKRRWRRECKVAVVHEGWDVRQGHGRKADYELKNPMYLPITEEGEAFWETVRGALAGRYEGIDEIPVIINGDGAEWIAPGAKWFRNGFYQYDRFHLVRELNDALRHDDDRRAAAQKALKQNDADGVIHAVAAALKDTREQKVYEKLRDVHTRLHKHREAIRDYRSRLREGGFKVDAQWRGMGAAESNMDKFENRIRKQGRAWGINGLRAMMTCLAELFEGNLTSHVSRHAQAKETSLLDRIQSGAGHVAKKLVEGSGVRSGGFPATQRGTEGYAALFRQLLQVKGAV